MASIPLPALSVRPPEQPDVLGQLSKLQALRNMGQQNQENQLKIQQEQQGLADQQAMTKAMHEWDGKNLDDLPSIILKNGGSANAVFSTKQQIVAQKEKLSQIAKDDATTGATNLETAAKKNDMLLGKLQGVTDGPSLIAAANDAVQSGLLDPQHAQQAAQIAQLPPDQFKQTLSIFEKSLMGQKAQFDQAMKERETAATELKAQNESTRLNAEMPGGPLANVERTKLTDWMRQNPGKTASDYDAAQAGAKAKAEQPYKLELAKAEATAKQAIEGMTKPVYAFAPDGSKSLMSQTDAMKAGVKTMVPVTEKALSDDTMLINRLGDVRQKIARYEQSMQTEISDKDRGNMAALISHSGFKVGAFGTEIPMDRLNAALQAENLQGLSPAARTQLVAYKNAMEAMVGYQRVLSGSGRSSEQAMNLNIGTLPDPSISDKAMAKESFGQFKENLGIVGQGLPKIPGIKSPEEVERQVTQPAGHKQGDVIVQNNQKFKVTQVDKDGRVVAADPL